MGSPIVTADEYAALLRLDFYAFIERSFAQQPDVRGGAARARARCILAHASPVGV